MYDTGRSCSTGIQWKLQTFIAFLCFFIGKETVCFRHHLLLTNVMLEISVSASVLHVVCTIRLSYLYLKIGSSSLQINRFSFFASSFWQFWVATRLKHRPELAQPATTTAGAFRTASDDTVSWHTSSSQTTGRHGASRVLGNSATIVASLPLHPNGVNWMSVCFGTIFATSCQ